MARRGFHEHDTSRLHPYLQTNCPSCGDWMFRLEYNTNITKRPKVRMRGLVGPNAGGSLEGLTIPIYGDDRDPRWSSIKLFDVKCRCGRLWIVDRWSGEIHPST